MTWRRGASNYRGIVGSATLIALGAAQMGAYAALGSWGMCAVGFVTLALGTVALRYSSQAHWLMGQTAAWEEINARLAGQIRDAATRSDVGRARQDAAAQKPHGVSGSK